MQGRMELFFFTKLNPAPAEEGKGWMILLARDVETYSSTALVSGKDRE